MKATMLAGLVALLLTAGTSGAPQSEWEEEEKEIDPAIRLSQNLNVLMDLMQYECLKGVQYNRKQSFHYYLITAFDVEMVKNLYIALIAKLIESHRSFEAVAADIANIYKGDSPATYDLMAEIQLRLFLYYDGHHNPLAWYLAYDTDRAYYFYRIRNNVLFANLSPDVKNALEVSTKRLPTPLELIFFAPQFCLRNHEYSDEYLLSSDYKVDGRRDIYTLPKYSKTASSPHIWRKHVVEAPASLGVALEGRANFGISLSSKAHNELIYLDHTRADRILGWPNGHDVEGSLWRLEFVSFSVTLEQNGLYLCASSERDRGGRGRYLKGIAKEGNSTFTRKMECHWYVEEC